MRPMSWYCGSHETSAIAAPTPPRRDASLAPFIARMLASSPRVLSLSIRIRCQRRFAVCHARGASYRASRSVRLTWERHGERHGESDARPQ